MIGQLKTGRRFLFRYALALALALCAIAACNNTLNEYKDGSYFVGSQRMITWAKSFGGTQLDTGNCVIQTSDGGYVIAGYSTSNDIDLTGNNGDEDIWIVKIDAHGALQWQRNFGGSQNERANKILQTSDGGYLLIGSTNSFDIDDGINAPSTYKGLYDILAIKLDASGNRIWQHCYGGAGNDYGEAVVPSGDGGFIIAGYTSSNNTHDIPATYGNQDAFLLKINSNGDTTWAKAKVYGGTQNDIFYDIKQLPSGGYIAAGASQSSDHHLTGSGQHGNYDMWVSMFNSNGDISSSKCYGGTNEELASSIAINPNGGYVVAGYTKSNDGTVSGHHNITNYDTWLISIDASLNLTWQQCYGGTANDQAYSIKYADSGYIVAGYTASSDGDVSGIRGMRDVWIFKINTGGGIVWQKNLGGSYDEEAYCTLPTSDNGYIIAGFSESINGDITDHRDDRDFWIVKVNDWGNW